MLERNNRPGDQPLDDLIVADAAAALDRQEPVHLSYPIRNSNRTVTARLSGVIAQRYGNKGLAEGTIRIDFHGSAGQSFGAFMTPGLHLTLTGEANDYVGKGMAGGTIVVRPNPAVGFDPHRNVIAGNTVLYGATGGHLFVAGRAGERFGVRCSGARAVVEGCGDHGCEYMTEGVVVVLGPTGRNFGAGMSAGLAYVYDEDGDFEQRCNMDMVSLERLGNDDDEAMLVDLIARHAELTGSGHATHMLAAWVTERQRFWKVVPHPVQVSTAAPVKAAPEPRAARAVAQRA